MKAFKSIDLAVFLSLLCITLFLLLLWPEVFRGGFMLQEWMWIPVLRLKFGFLTDGLSLPILFILTLVFTMSSLYSIPYMASRIREGRRMRIRSAHLIYYALYFLYFVSVAGAILATNLVEFYVFLEVALISSFFLVFLYGRGEREKAAITYFIWMHVGSLSLLAGIFLAGWSIGSFEIADLPLLSRDPIAILFIAFVTLCFFVKMAVLGLHAWLPVTYVAAPAPVTAAIGATSVCLGTYGIIRLLSPLHHVAFGVSGWLELWASLTILYGAFMALMESVGGDFKRLVAYLSQSQMNFCTLGAFTYIAWGVAGAASYSISHGLAIALLFLAAGSIFYRVKTYEIGQLGGLVTKMPWVVIATVIGFFTIAGIPPTIGFMSKFVLIAGAFQRALSAFGPELAAAILALVGGILTIAYQLIALGRIFFGPLPERLQDIKRLPYSMLAPLLVLGATSLIMGVYPETIKRPLGFAVERLLEAK